MVRGRREDTISVRQQGWSILLEMFDRGKGTSKHQDKIEAKDQFDKIKKLLCLHPDDVGLQDQLEDVRHKLNGDPQKIYTDSTLNDYLRWWNDYCDTMKRLKFKVDGHSPRSLSEAAEFMPTYIEDIKKRPGKRAGTFASAWTVRAQFAGPAKVLGLRAADYDLPSRRLDNISRSRISVDNDRHFSERKNAALVNFCRCMGPRSSKELAYIRGTDLIQFDDGAWGVHIEHGKGGKRRNTRFYGSKEEIQQAVDLMLNAGDDLIFAKIHSAADIHGYRAEFARRVYDSVARDPETIPQSERYYCRGDRAGTWYDKRALLAASVELGHGPDRYDVVAKHYMGRGVSQS